MKIKKCHKLACILYDKNNYVAHIRTSKQVLTHRLILKKEHRVIQFNQKAGLKPYIEKQYILRTLYYYLIMQSS